MICVFEVWHGPETRIATLISRATQANQELKKARYFLVVSKTCERGT